MVKVKMYKTHTCPYCKMEGEYLKEKGIAFDEIYVDDDPTKAQEMMDASGQLGVPFTIIENNGEEVQILGFDKKKINKALNL